jgi:hypothetical protein
VTVEVTVVAVGAVEIIISEIPEIITGPMAGEIAGPMAGEIAGGVAGGIIAESAEIAAIVMWIGGIQAEEGSRAEDVEEIVGAETMTTIDTAEAGR